MSRGLQVGVACCSRGSAVTLMPGASLAQRAHSTDRTHCHVREFRIPPRVTLLPNCDCVLRFLVEWVLHAPVPGHGCQCTQERACGRIPSSQSSPSHLRSRSTSASDSPVDLFSSVSSTLPRRKVSGLSHKPHDHATLHRQASCTQPNKVRAPRRWDHASSVLSGCKCARPAST